MELKVSIPALEKLLEYGAAAVGSVTEPVMEVYRSKLASHSNRMAAISDAETMLIRAKAHRETLDILIPSEVNDHDLYVDLNIDDKINQRIRFQEKKRQKNIKEVVIQAAEQLENKLVIDKELDYDWIARFFNEVQDVSSDDMKKFWSRILAGEIETPGNTSIRTLSILKNLDQKTAILFKRLCSLCIYSVDNHNSNIIYDARVPTLGGHAGDNCLAKYGLDYFKLNILHEHGLIIQDYNSYANICVRPYDVDIYPEEFVEVFQGKKWDLTYKENVQNKTFPDNLTTLKLYGVALTEAGKELSKVVEIELSPGFENDLKKYLDNQRFSFIILNDLTT